MKDYTYDWGGKTRLGETQLIDYKSIPCPYKAFFKNKQGPFVCAVGCMFKHDFAPTGEHKNLREWLKVNRLTCPYPKNCYRDDCPFMHFRGLDYNKPQKMVPAEKKKVHWAPVKGKSDKQSESIVAGSYKVPAELPEMASIFKLWANTDRSPNGSMHATYVAGYICFIHHEVDEPEWKGSRWIDYSVNGQSRLQEIKLEECDYGGILDRGALVRWKPKGDFARHGFKSLIWGVANDNDHMMVATIKDGMKVSFGMIMDCIKMIHNATTVPGDCGAPYLVGGKVVGIHCWGAPRAGMNGGIYPGMQEGGYVIPTSATVENSVHFQEGH